MSQAGVRGRVLLLAAQAFALGLTVAWTTIPASAIFLEVYGSGLLPVTYLGAAATGALSTVLLARAVRRRPLAVVATRLFVVATITFAVSWGLLVYADATWVAFMLLVLLPLAVPVGFMFIVGQAGMLLDVRTMKARYPKVIAGFALGFTVGGLAGPVIASGLGDTKQLVMAAGVSSLTLLLLVHMTRVRHPAELSSIDGTDDADVQRVTLRTLLQDRFVVLIMTCQMLSAVESQWLDYLVYDRAAQRYSDQKELATFIGRFLAIAYGADILFLLLLAGFLLSRFGMRLGLTANPTVVLAIVSCVVIGGATKGSGATVVFVLVVSARIGDLVLSDGATRNSVSATYQAIAMPKRLAAQANVESLAVPVAIGISGLGLIVIQASTGTSGLVLPVLTGVVLAAWIVVALITYRGYGVNLLANLRQRLLDPAELSIDGPNAMVAVDRLLASDDPRDFRLGLVSALSVRPDDLAARLEQIAMADQPVAYSETLEALVTVDPARAGRVAKAGLRHSNGDIRSSSLLALGRIGQMSHGPWISDALDDDHHDVIVAAAAATARLGSDHSLADLDIRVARLARAGEPASRVLAARVLGVCHTTPAVDRAVLRDLLHDPESDVRIAALDAVTWPIDGNLRNDLLEGLKFGTTSGAAVSALVRGASAAIELADRVLVGELTSPRESCLLLVRVCRTVGGPEAVEVLRRHVGHPDRDVGLAVVRALIFCLNGNPATDDEHLGSELVRADVEHAAHVIRVSRAVSCVGSAGALRSALTDELDLLRQRVLAGLALRYGQPEVERVQLQLGLSSPREHALALEWLDVTLKNDDRPALAFLEPGMSEDDLARRLGRTFAIPSSNPVQALRDIISDPESRWRRPWLTACALVAAAGLAEPDAELLEPDIARHGPGSQFHDNDLRGHDRDLRVHDHDNIISETLAGLRQRRTASAVG